MQFGGYVGIARRWWFTILAATIVGGSAGWLVAGALPVRYRSEVRLLVGPVNADFNTLRASGELTQTYANLATSQEVLSAAAGSAGLTQSPGQLADAVRTTPDDRARIVTIAVELGTPEEASRAADAIAQALAAYISKAPARPEGELRVVDPASPGEPSGLQRTPFIVLVCALAALLGGILLVSLIELVDRTLRDVGQVRQMAGSAFLGNVPISQRGGLSRRERGARAPLIEGPAYRRVFADLSARAPARVRSILVVGTGKPADAREVAGGLATAALQVGARVAIVNADEGPGEATYDLPSLSASHILILTGRGIRDPQAAAALLDHALRGSDLAIVAAGSSSESFAAAIWAQVVDLAIVVTVVGRDQRGALEKAMERLTTFASASPWVLAATPGQGEIHAFVPDPGATVVFEDGIVDAVESVAREQSDTTRKVRGRGQSRPRLAAVSEGHDTVRTDVRPPGGADDATNGEGSRPRSRRSLPRKGP